MDQRSDSDAVPSLTVRGVGIAPVQPDGVRVVLTVLDRRSGADEALGQAANRARQLETLFGELGIDPDRWVTTGLSIDEWSEWDEQSRREIRQGYTASSRIFVTVSNLDDLGHLLAEAAARTDATMEGPYWHIAPDNPAHDESRRRAMADARRRAETYAEAAGLVVGALVQAVEVSAGPPRAPMRAPAHVAIAMQGAAPEMPVAAEGLQIFAAIDVTFLLTSS